MECFPYLSTIPMPIYQIGDHIPQIDPSAFVAESATIIGNVVIEAGASVWYGCTVRADNDRITIGANSNIQDGSVLHSDPGYPLSVGRNVTVGHLAMLHGCTIGDGALVGIRATVLNGSIIASNCLVGAGALVTEGKSMPENALVLGAPARVARVMNEQEVKNMQSAAAHYVKQGSWYMKELKRID